MFSPIEMPAIVTNDGRFQGSTVGQNPEICDEEQFGHILAYPEFRRKFPDFDPSVRPPTLRSRACP